MPTRSLSLLGAVLLFAATARAQDSVAAPVAPVASAPAASASTWDPSIKRVGVTVAPIMFIIGFEGAAEFLVSPSVGLVGIFGMGSFSPSVVGGSDGPTFSWREIGGQCRYYFSKKGKGAHVGVELMNIKVELEEGYGSTDAMASGTAFGPLLGWKGVWGPGFTFCAQGGYQFMTMDAEASDGDESASKSGSAGVGLLNLDVGWSF